MRRERRDDQTGENQVNPDDLNRSSNGYRKTGIKPSPPIWRRSRTQTARIMA
jgi:hypothetical protein